MPIDYPELDSQIDQQEAYDEGLEDIVDIDPYVQDDDPEKANKSRTASRQKYTVNHDVIRRWVRFRYGHPAHVIGVGGGDLDEGGLYIHFEDDEPPIDVEQISWSKFFEIFDKHQLAFLYRTKNPDGSQSKFFRFMTRRDVSRLTNATPVG